MKKSIILIGWFFWFAMGDNAYRVGPFSDFDHCSFVEGRVQNGAVVVIPCYHPKILGYGELPNLK